LSSEDLGKLLRQKDEDGRSLLHAAAAAAGAQALEMLLAQGTAAVNEVDDEVRA
jgi:ankyrin repeat protein